MKNIRKRGVGALVVALITTFAVGAPALAEDVQDPQTAAVTTELAPEVPEAVVIETPIADVTTPDPVVETTPAQDAASVPVVEEADPPAEIVVADPVTSTPETTTSVAPETALAAATVVTEVAALADTTAPKALVKPSLTELTGTLPAAQSYSFALRDNVGVAGTWLNGTWKAVSPNKFSDYNNIRPGQGGAVQGPNEFIVQDTSGNLSVPYTPVLDTEGPIVTVRAAITKDGGAYQKVSFGFEDLYSQVDYVVLKGKKIDLSNDKFSNLNDLTAGDWFGTSEGLNDFQVVDTLGNVTNHPFVIDTTKQVLTLPEGVTIGARPYTFHITQVEANPYSIYAEIQQKVNGKWVKRVGQEFKGVNEVDFTVKAGENGIVEGLETQLKVSTTDRANNQTSKTSPVGVDLTGPSINWQLQPAASYKIGDGFHVRPITNETGAIKSVYIDAVAPENLVYTSTGEHKNLDVKDTQNSALWANLADGTHTFIAVFEDQYGNVTTKSSDSFLLDRTPVVVEFVTPSDDATLRGIVPVTVRLFDDNLKSYNLRVDSAGLQYLYQASNGEVTFALDTKTLSDGVHTLLATATDSVGNKTTVTIKRTIDNTKPTIAIITPDNGAVLTTDNLGSVELSVTDGIGLKSAVVNLYQDGKLFKSLGSQQISGTEATVTWQLPANLPAGTYEIRGGVSDTAGWTTATKVEVTVQEPESTTPPVNGGEDDNGTEPGENPGSGDGDNGWIPGTPILPGNGGEDYTQGDEEPVKEQGASPVSATNAVVASGTVTTTAPSTTAAPAAALAITGAELSVLMGSGLALLIAGIVLVAYRQRRNASQS